MMMKKYSGKKYSGKKNYKASPQRSLNYDQEYKLTRNATCYVAFNASGFFFNQTYVQSGIGIIYSLNQALIVMNTTTASTVTAAIPNPAEISSLWQKLKIEKIEVTCDSRTQDPVNTTTANSTPIVYYSQDYTSVYGTDINIIQQEKGCKTWHATSDNRLSFTVRPKYQRIIYKDAAGLNPGYEPVSGFVTSQNDVPHYGTRMAIKLGNGLGSGGIIFNFKFFFSLKGVK